MQVYRSAWVSDSQASPLGLGVGFFTWLVMQVGMHGSNTLGLTGLGARVSSTPASI